MNKLTTEQLLFAHRIGATQCRFEQDHAPCYYKNIGNNGKYLFWSRTSIQWDCNKGLPIGWNEGYVYSIDFTPLYNQWIDHDGGECPVGDDDAVVVEFGGIHDGDPLFFHSADGVSWTAVERFKLHRSEDWPEQRADAIGQNGNTGEHYEAAPEASDGSTASKYHREISPGVWVDVYDVLKAWRVENPALQHLIKKALQPGERGHKTLEQDMDDIIASAIRAKALAE